MLAEADADKAATEPDSAAAPEGAEEGDGAEEGVRARRGRSRMARGGAAPAAEVAALVSEPAPKTRKSTAPNMTGACGMKQSDPAATRAGSTSSSKAAAAGASNGSSTKAAAAAASVPSLDTLDSSALVALLVAAAKKCPDLVQQVQAAMGEV